MQGDRFYSTATKIRKVDVGFPAGSACQVCTVGGKSVGRQENLSGSDSILVLVAICPR